MKLSKPNIIKCSHRKKVFIRTIPADETDEICKSGKSWWRCEKCGKWILK